MTIFKEELLMLKTRQLEFKTLKEIIKNNFIKRSKSGSRKSMTLEAILILPSEKQTEFTLKFQMLTIRSTGIRRSTTQLCMNLSRETNMTTKSLKR